MGPETNGLMLQANPVTSTYKVKRCVQLKETIGQKEWQVVALGDRLGAVWFVTVC